jgi:hypothetical protein
VRVTGLSIIGTAEDPDAPEITVLKIDFIPHIIYADGAENRSCIHEFADRGAVQVQGAGILGVDGSFLKGRKQIIGYRLWPRLRPSRPIA